MMTAAIHENMRTGVKQARRPRADFETAVRQHTARLLAVAGRFLPSEEDAADAVQDAFVSAFAAWRTFQSRSSEYTWLYRIVVNACLMRIRSRSRARTVSLDGLLPTFDERGRHRHPVPCWTMDGDSRLEREETRAAVRACIERLPDDYRTIILLRDIEGLDTGASARLLGLSRVATKTRLHRARQALRALLEETSSTGEARA